jgi:protein TonB
MKSVLAWFFSILGVIGVLVGLAAGVLALDPSEIEELQVDKPKPIAVKIPDPPKSEEPPPPPEPTANKSLLADLAPDSFSNAMPDLGGIGFGSGGSGPAVGGSGGFGTDAGTLVKSQSSVDRPPRAVLKQPPEYPQEARSRGVSGFVVLNIFVGQSGLIENVKVDQSEPRGFFDEAALKSIRAWRFEPAITKGQTVAAWTKQKIKFELN